MNAQLRFVFILSVSLLIIIMGCNSDSPVTSSEALNFESGEFAVFSADDAMAAIVDPGISSPMHFDDDIFNGRAFHDGERFGRRGPHGPRGRDFRKGNHLGEILRQLQLTETQREQVRALMQEHRDCIQEPLQQFRDANEEIIAEANTEREAILNAMRAGDITREEARQQLQELAERTREAIRANPESQATLEALCDCKEAHFAAIRELLDETQQAVWDGWVAGLENLCF